MIAKAVKGTSFKGAVSYDLDPEKGALLDTNMAGETPAELAAEFEAIRDLRPGVTKAVLHVSLTAAPGDQLSDEQWRDIGQQFRAGMGLDHNQYVLTRHTDTEHDHIHLVANRIDLAGQVVSDSHDYQRMHTLMREIERDYGLQEVTSQPAARHAPTKGELERTLRTGAPSTRHQLQALCDGAAQDCRSLTTYIERLDAVGVETTPTVQQQGAKLSGLQYCLDGVTMKGSDLGKAYAAAGIQNRGISYEQERDSAAVDRCRDRAAAREDRGADRERAAGQGPERGGVGRALGAAGASAGALSGGDEPALDPGGSGSRSLRRADGRAGPALEAGGDGSAGSRPQLAGGGVEAPRPLGADRGNLGGARERILALAASAADREPAEPGGDGRESAPGADRSPEARRRQAEALGGEETRPAGGAASRWEAIKETAGALVSRVTERFSGSSPEEIKAPPAAQMAASQPPPAPQVRHVPEATAAPTPSAEQVARDPDIPKRIAQIQDPVQRAEAETLLKEVRAEVSARESSNQPSKGKDEGRER